MRLEFPLATSDTKHLNNHLLKLIGDSHLKMLIILEVLGGCGRICIHQYEKEVDEIGIPIGNIGYKAVKKPSPEDDRQCPPQNDDYFRSAWWMWKNLYPAV